jgi:hypothetical protein
VAVGSLLEQLDLPDWFIPVELSIRGMILNIFRQKYLNSMTLHLRQGREFESNGNLRAKRKRFARNDNVIVQLILPFPGYCDWFDLFQTTFGGRSNQGYFLGAYKVCPERP